MTAPVKITPRERDAIIQAMTAGVVPRLGLPHVQAGRKAEILALLRDIDRIADGGASIRLIIGPFGAGKSFFSNLIRFIALERKCVTVNADLAPERRIHGSEGQARSLYSELVKNISTRNKPEGNALASIIEKFVTDAVIDAAERAVSVEKVVDERLSPIREYVGGFDFSTVLKAYWRGSEQGDETLKISALRWLRGEYSTKTEARQALGVRTIVDDENIYDSLKMLASFVRIVGYTGLMVLLDEMAILYKLQNSQARKQNYEEILRILNDILQGTASGIGFVMCGTPEFLLDTHRGLHSYEALQSRLAENPFTSGGLVDFLGPIIRLENLTPEDLLVILSKIRLVFACGDPSKYLVPEEALPAFMDYCNQRIGESYFRTPRTTLKAFVQLLAVLEQNPRTDWRGLLGSISIVRDVENGNVNDDNKQASKNDELTNLRINS